MEYSLEHIDTAISKRYNINQDVYNVTLTQPNHESMKNISMALYNTMNKLANEIKETLDPENDRIGLSMVHPDLIAESIDVPMQRPKNLTGEIIFTHIGNVVQSGHTLFNERLLPKGCLDYR